MPACLDAVHAALSSLGARAGDLEAVIVSENIEATARALHFEVQPGVGAIELPSGPVVVTDTARALFGEDPPIPAGVTWQRRATSFFQGNRFLTGSLVRRVLELAVGDRCIDLYSGVGLFAVALAAQGKKVLAVEGDASSAEDLAINAAPWRTQLRAVRGAVEAAVDDVPDPVPDVVVVDPPRTGLSATALRRIASWRCARIVYVSCDPPTLARDTALLIERGYVLDSVAGFDLFPNTPHVEAVASFSYSLSR